MQEQETLEESASASPISPMHGSAPQILDFKPPPNFKYASTRMRGDQTAIDQVSAVRPCAGCP